MNKDKYYNIKIMNKGYGKTYHEMLQLIINLQQENERLKDNQVRTLNRIRDFINSSKCEITEGSYSNDKHSQYWSMFKRFAEELQDKIKGIDTKDYVYIPKWREQELLNQEEQLEDYKSRCEKASEILKKLDLDKYTYTKENRKHTINDLLNTLQNGSDE